MKNPNSKTLLSVVAWAVVLFVSLLPDIVFRETTGFIPGWLFVGKILLLGVGLAASLLWNQLRPLRLFFSVLLLVNGVTWAADWVNYSAWLASAEPFVREVAAVQIPRFAAAAAVVLGMLLLTGRPDRFFFGAGRLDTAAAPIPLIMTRPTPWRILGPFIAGAMSLGLVAFAFIFGQPPAWWSFLGIVPLLPVILVFAAGNAFGEEMLYRAPWLAALEGPVGPAQALLMTSVYFGLGHFYGVPYGVVGVVMAFIPGWLMGKAMLETRGLFWAWFIHFWMDAVIFIFMALGSVRPGG